MKLILLAVGRKMPAWVDEGYQEYARRLNKDCSLELVAIDTGKRSKKSSASENKREDASKIIKSFPAGSYVVALDERGKEHSTASLAKKLDAWKMLGKDVCIIIGGADGLDQQVLGRADETWSLSRLTLPHPLVRVLVAEQLYRAWSLLNNHPYHRE